MFLLIWGFHAGGRGLDDKNMKTEVCLGTSMLSRSGLELSVKEEKWSN